ncbi:MAG TPA: dTDP-4-dehydrorhamnose 3,5-epimerase [Fimbriimonas sp.]|nr:dTDP-4-dehydrorhamnose 3,5-epimerase [Fimbriimonas sp.]
MTVRPTRLPGVLVVEPRVFSDARGFFAETYQRQRYQEAGILDEFVQDNLSCSSKGTLRGLHYQNPNPQAKLVQVLRGEVFDVAVDIRLGSPTFGQWVGETLSESNRLQLYVPQGFAHGFVVISDEALFCYKVGDYYNPGADGGVRWDDPDIAIEWPVSDPMLSPKDAAAPLLREIDSARLSF